MRKRWVYVVIALLALATAYLLGPSPDAQQWNTNWINVPSDPLELENYVATREAAHRVKEDNEARIVWFDSAKTKTEYSVVYLHGFSASQEEGDPVHTDFAKAFGCNLYLARLADHGIDTTEQLLYFTGDRFWESAKEALAIGEAIGDKVILMTTSTGGTVALMLAAAYPDKVAAMINMSPNIEINNPTAWLLNNPWGLQIARRVLGGNYQVIAYSPERQQYWNQKYRIEAIVQLQEMVEDRMDKDTFSKVTCPTLTLYYYKDEQNQDPTVRVSAMRTMHQQLGTPDSLKAEVAIPEAGAHVIGSHLVSKDVKSVSRACAQFAKEKLGMVPATSL
jgi:pimeloyl-ACP methyl ester carboxylesterase